MNITARYAKPVIRVTWTHADTHQEIMLHALRVLKSCGDIQSKRVYDERRIARGSGKTDLRSTNQENDMG